MKWNVMAQVFCPGDGQMHHGNGIKVSQTEKVLTDFRCTKCGQKHSRAGVPARSTL